ncbi:tyrosine-type recombinase/integrase [Anaerotruncus rubiinfantis]|uniref:tyrosine-type recombinase/integrase n=1 Tax=Anaerotruncus rubiinfantis TaxID=1720200 RepID=UPI00083779FE|nr:tyrosine-type recombinase/integrase [Anaerotruncus rubiinfantis]
MTKRQAKKTKPQYQMSEGGIYPRKDGRYTAQIYIDGDKRTFTSTEEKAEIWLSKIKAEVALGIYQKPEKKEKQKEALEPVKPSQEITLGEWLDRWLEIYAQPSVKLATYVSYETYIRRHLKPSLGQILMKDLTVGILQDFLTKKLTGGRADGRKGGLSPKTVSNIHKMLLPALEQARIENLLPENLARSVKPPKVEREEMRVLSIDEQKRFVAACLRFHQEEPNALASMVALFFGPRLGEVLGMQWKNVSFEKRQFKLTHTLSRLKNLNPHIPSKTTLELRTLKSRNSKRTLDMFDAMYDLLLAHKKAQDDIARKMPGYNPMGFVFVTPDGQPVEPRTYEDFFYKISVAAEIKGATFHTLRHTFATRCIENGIDILVLSKIMGHSNPETTLKLYGHILSEHKRNSMLRVGTIYSTFVELPAKQKESQQTRNEIDEMETLSLSMSN